MSEEPIVLGPVVESMRSWTWLGWYGVIRVRRHWWQLWRPRTKLVYGVNPDAVQR